MDFYEKRSKKRFLCFFDHIYGFKIFIFFPLKFFFGNLTVFSSNETNIRIYGKSFRWLSQNEPI
jgi:hypothetical protein